ncbi:MAG: shikimate dehydrogenase, partial [Flavobacteriaceae bacterium]
MTKKEPLKKFGLLGRNIDYSFSRTYFSDKFSKEN